MYHIKLALNFTAPAVHGHSLAMVVNRHSDNAATSIDDWIDV